MTQELFRNRIISNIKKAIQDADDASDIGNNVIKGRVREIALSNLFKPILPGGFEVGTGAIIDFSGYQSPEIDLIIYNKDILPPILYSDRDGHFPAESCFYAIEVKSILNRDEITRSFNNAKKLNSLKYVSGFYSKDMPIQHEIKLVVPLLFAFKTDLASDGKTDIERYAEIDPNFKTNPTIRFICVVGRGYWHFNKNYWIFNPPTGDYDEVIEFLSFIVNFLPDLRLSRGRPNLGDYLIKEERLSKISLLK